MAVSLVQGAVAGAALAAVAVVVARPAFLTPPPSIAGLATPAPAASTPVLPRHTAAPAPVAAVVYVAGAVAHPGVYTIAASARVADAVARAGGLSAVADPVAVNLAAHVSDGEEIAVPRVGEVLAGAGSSAASHRPSRGSHGRRGRHRQPPAGPIDLNTADPATLATIPGIGPTLAARIVAFRDANGPFASVDGLADVAGITPARFSALMPYLTVGQP